VCSCQDNKSWSNNISCTYHSVGQLEPEYQRQQSPPPVSSVQKDNSSTLSPRTKILQPSLTKEKSTKRHSSLSTAQDSDQLEGVNSVPEPPTSKMDTPTHGNPPEDRSDRCRHVFKPGEDIYHCQDCSVDDRVVICSRCFHGSACIHHRWRMGEFLGSRSRPNVRSSSSSSSSQPSNTSSHRSEQAGKSNGAHSGASRRASDESEALSVLVDGLSIQAEPLRNIPVDKQSSNGKSIGSTTQEEEAEKSAPKGDEESGVDTVATCDCGDPSLFKTAFDCNYHLPDEYRPMPHLVQCNYLFLRGDTMYNCRTCYENTGAETTGTTAWICEHCFDPQTHKDHEVEKMTNARNEGLYCHCGSPDQHPITSVASASPRASTAKVLREKSASEGPGENVDMGKEGDDNNSKTDQTITGCTDDHNRQTVLCSREIKEGMFYYKCQVTSTQLTALRNFFKEFVC